VFGLQSASAASELTRSSGGNETPAVFLTRALAVVLHHRLFHSGLPKDAANRGFKTIDLPYGTMLPAFTSDPVARPMDHVIFGFLDAPRSVRSLCSADLRLPSYASARFCSYILGRKLVTGLVETDRR
jgi:hypothetical protein